MKALRVSRKSSANPNFGYVKPDENGRPLIFNFVPRTVALDATWARGNQEPHFPNTSTQPTPPGRRTAGGEEIRNGRAAYRKSRLIKRVVPISSPGCGRGWFFLDPSHSDFRPRSLPSVPRPAQPRGRSPLPSPSARSRRPRQVLERPNVSAGVGYLGVSPGPRHRGVDRLHGPPANFRGRMLQGRRKIWLQACLWGPAARQSDRDCSSRVLSGEARHCLLGRKPRRDVPGKKFSAADRPLGDVGSSAETRRDGRPTLPSFPRRAPSGLVIACSNIPLLGREWQFTAVIVYGVFTNRKDADFRPLEFPSSAALVGVDCPFVI